MRQHTCYVWDVVIGSSGSAHTESEEVRNLLGKRCAFAMILEIRG